MKQKKIDISTPELQEEVYQMFASCSSKSEAHKLFNISDNSPGIKYLQEIANTVGFDLNIYAERRKRETNYCIHCGKLLTGSQKKFCSKSCAASYNNSRRIKTKPTPEGIDNKQQVKKIAKGKQTVITKVCPVCKKSFTAANHNVKFCSNSCSALDRHNKQYQLFLTDNESFCRGNYTPKSFKGEFLKEQLGVCAICGALPLHNNKPLVFVLDHINGDASDNRRENLRMICPNCDSQLDTFKSKNKNSSRRNYWKEHILKMK